MHMTGATPRVLVGEVLLLSPSAVQMRATRLALLGLSALQVRVHTLAAPPEGV